MFCITAITEFSCNFDSGLCSWTPVQVRNRYRWTYGFRIDDRFPVVDHTSACKFNKKYIVYTIFYYELYKLQFNLTFNKGFRNNK